MSARTPGVATMLAFVALFATTSARATSAFESQPTPSPSPSASILPGPTPIPNSATCEPGAMPIDFASSFAIPIRSPRTLRFLSYLDRVSEREQRAIVDAVLANRPPDAKSDFELGCRTVVGLATTRALNLTSYRWTARFGDRDDRNFVAMTRALDRAIRALSADGPPDRTALAPFHYDSSLMADATSVPSPCSFPGEDAHTLVVSQAMYPMGARLTRTQGHVDVAVGIDAAGFVESARAVRTDTTGPNGFELVESSIFAAAESTYAPERVACAAVAGAYLFRVDFVGR